MTNEELERRVVSLEHDLERMKEEQHQKEVSYLKVGVTILGGIVVTGATWIWGQIDHLITLRVGK